MSQAATTAFLGGLAFGVLAASLFWGSARSPSAENLSSEQQSDGLGASGARHLLQNASLDPGEAPPHWDTTFNHEELGRDLISVRVEDTPREPDARESSELDRAKPAIAGWEAEVLGLREQLRRVDERWKLLDETLEDQSFRHGDRYRVLLSYFLDPELTTSDPKTLVSTLEELIQDSGVLSQGPEEGVPGQLVWRVVLEPGRSEDLNRPDDSDYCGGLEISWSEETERFQVPEGRVEARAENLRVSVALPRIPSPPNWSNWDIHDARVELDITEFGTLGWFVQLDLQSGHVVSRSCIELAWDGSGDHFSLFPVRGGKLEGGVDSRESRQFYERSLAFFQPFFRRLVGRIR